MREEKPNIGPYTKKYLFWVVGSDTYKEKKVKILKLHEEGQDDEVTKEIETLCNHFMTPETLRPALRGFILYDSDKNLPNISVTGVRKGTKEFNIHGPAIVMVIQNRITEDEFKSLWKRVNQQQTGDFKMPNLPQFKPLFTGRQNPKPYFEKHLNWYKKLKAGMSYQLIAETEGTTYSHDDKDIENNVKKIIKLMEGMKGEL